MDQGEVCRLTVQATCALVRRCAPELGGIAACPTLLEATCAQGLPPLGASADRPPSRKKLQRCLEQLAKLPCEKFTLGPEMVASLPTCSSLDSKAANSAE